MLLKMSVFAPSWTLNPSILQYTVTLEHVNAVPLLRGAEADATAGGMNGPNQNGPGTVGGTTENMPLSTYS